MKKTIVTGLLILAGLYIMQPTMAAVFRPRTEYAPAPTSQGQPVLTIATPTLSIIKYEPIPTEAVYAPQPIATTAPILTSPTLPPIPTREVQEQEPQPQPTATRDWTPEITATTRNLQNAIDIVEACAMDKVQGALEMPPRIRDCTPAVDNLNVAKQKIKELSALIEQEGQ